MPTLPPTPHFDILHNVETSVTLLPSMDPRTFRHLAQCRNVLRVLGALGVSNHGSSSSSPSYKLQNGYFPAGPFSFLLLENAPEKIQQQSRLKDYQRDQLWVLYIHPYLVAHPGLSTTLPEVVVV